MTRGIRRSAGPLDQRAQSILRAVIEEYIASAAPVGSQTLVERYHLQVSSATVRAVLAELEAEGLLYHPHTSAGRVPTDAGYRFYVESLTGDVPLSPIEQLMIRHQFGQVEFATDQWFRLAATTLASATHSAGIATPAKPRAARIRRFELIPIGDRMASLIIVLNEGTLKQALFTLDAGTREEDLDEAVRRLNASCAGRSAADVAEHLRWFAQAPADDATFELVRRAGDRALRLLREFDAATVEQLFSDGLLNVMAAPEFASSEKLRGVFEALENRTYFAELFDAVTTRRRPAGLHREREQAGRDGRREPRPGTLRAAGRCGRLRGSARAHPTPLPAGDRDRALRVRDHERPRGPPLHLKPGGTACRTTLTTLRRTAGRARTTGSPSSRRARPRSSPRSRQLTAERDAALAKADENLVTAQRAAADYANLKRRSEADRERDLDRAREALLTRVVELADDFDLALEHLPPEARDNPWLEGIVAIDRKLRGLLEREGVTPIEALGQPFDPNEHEALSHVTGSGAAEGEVVLEIRRGYRLRDRVLRPALVAVSDGSPRLN